MLVAWSGGKDSTMTLAALGKSPRWRPAALLTTVTEEHDRISMHGVRVALLRAQAASLDLPLRIVHIPPESSNATYEERMSEALEEARGEGIRRVAFGDLYLREVREHRETMLATVGMKGLFPLWGLRTAALARDFIAAGYRAILTCVDTEQIDGSFAGREYDESLLADLPASADPCGENGEFHTFVHDGPGFARSVVCERGERVLRADRFQYCDLL